MVAPASPPWPPPFPAGIFGLPDRERQAVDLLLLYQRANDQAEAAKRGQGALLLLMLSWYIPVAINGALPWWALGLLWLWFLSLAGALKKDARDTLRRADAAQAEYERASKRPHPPASLN